MSVSKKLKFIPFLLIVALFTVSSLKAEERAPLHTSGDKTLYDRKLNKIDLIGNAAVHQNGESLYADKITLEVDTKIVHAIGNVSFVGKNALIQSKEMHFNLETKTGTIISGRVSTESFTLSGERINKLGENRFQVYRGEYSTCKDCPQSWTLEARDVDMEIEGYAFLSNVTAKISDAPAFWIPYMVVPIKTKRQSGFLIPRFGSGTKGFIFVQPFFWAINRSFDMTLGGGTYGGRGRRLEWEGRYALHGGDGTANFWHLTDRTFRDYLQDRGYLNRPDHSTNRWAAQVDQKHELPFGIFEKLRFREVSDNLYPSLIGDIDPKSNPYLTSDFSLTRSTDSLSVYLYGSRYRNLLNRSNQEFLSNQVLNEDPRDFDHRTVQVLPQAVVTSNDKLIFGNNVAAGISVGVTEFTRGAGPFDEDIIQTVVSDPKPPSVVCATQICPGQDPIREATRFTINPRLSSSFRPFDVISVMPSVQYKHYYYDFHQITANSQTIPNLNRGYLQLKTDLSTELSRIYENDNPEMPRLKHFIRPRLSYSLIPYRKQPDHPFVRQIEYAQGNNVTGYNFDSEDIVPLDASTSYANYFLPLGHSLNYGFTSQLIRKKVPKRTRDGEIGESTYQRSVTWSAGQSVNFREFKKEEEQEKPLSRVSSQLALDFDKFTGSADYSYTPYQPKDESTSRHVYSMSAAYTFEKGVRHRILEFERSIRASYYYNRSSAASQTEQITAGIVYSINDFILPSFYMEYNLAKKRWQSAVTTLAFQSPSQCWRLDLGLTQTIRERENPGDKAWGTTFQFNLALNLTGAGYGGMPGSQFGSGPSNGAR